jgi:hypothetical protein
MGFIAGEVPLAYLVVGSGNYAGAAALAGK